MFYWLQTNTIFFFDAGDEDHLAMYGMKEAHESSGVIPGVPVSMSRPL